MRRGIYLAVLGVVVSGAVIVTISVAQVYPVRWYEAQPEPAGAAGPSLVLADGHLQFPDGTVQRTAAGSGESLGAPPSPSVVLADGGIQFPDGSVQTTAAGSLVPRTGQTICYDAAGAVVTCGTGIGLAQDGDLQLGVSWPNPRFTINESSPAVPDGTVTDNLTGLIWLADANCANATMDWAAALAFANSLFDGSTTHNGGDCGLSDGSLVGAWRLPNLRELQSLVHYGVSSPAIPNTAGTGKWVAGDPFSGVQSATYWSSSSGVFPGNAWVVGMIGGGSLNVGKIDTSSVWVWPVRN